MAAKIIILPEGNQITKREISLPGDQDGNIVNMKALLIGHCHPPRDTHTAEGRNLQLMNMLPG